MGYSEKHGRAKRKREDMGEGAWLVRSCFAGFGVAVVFALVLWLISSILVYSQNDPDAVVGIFGFATVYVAALASGFVSVKLNGGKALLCGCISGALFSLFFLVISMFFGDSYSSGYSPLSEIGLRGAMILMSVLGAFAGIHHKKKKRVHKKR